MGPAEDAAAPLAGDGGEVDDAAVVLLLHDLADLPGQHEQGEHVHGEDALHVSQGHVGHGDLLGDAGVVHQHVDAAVAFERRLYQGVRLRAFGEIGVHGERVEPRTAQIRGKGKRRFL